MTTVRAEPYDLRLERLPGLDQRRPPGRLWPRAPKTSSPPGNGYPPGGATSDGASSCCSAVGAGTTPSPPSSRSIARGWASLACFASSATARATSSARSVIPPTTRRRRMPCGTRFAQARSAGRTCSSASSCSKPRGGVRDLGWDHGAAGEQPRAAGARAELRGGACVPQPQFSPAGAPPERKLLREHGLRYRLADDPHCSTPISPRCSNCTPPAGVKAAPRRSPPTVRPSTAKSPGSPSTKAGFASGWPRWTTRLVAALYGFRFAGSELYYQSGRDPAWDRYAVGFVLLTHAVRAALEEGVSEYRFLRGGET